LFCILLLVTLQPAIKLQELTSGSLKFIDLPQLSPWLASMLVILVGAYLLLKGLSNTMSTLANYVISKEGVGAAEANEQMSQELQSLFKKLKPRGGKFVLFIDDLERCSAGDAVAVFELATQLMNFEEAVIVILADINFLIDTCETDNKEMAQNYARNRQSEGDEISYGREYLQKLIQLQFDLPSHGDRINNLTPVMPRPREPVDEKQGKPRENKIGRDTLAGARQYMDKQIQSIGATQMIDRPSDFSIRTSQWKVLQVERKQRFLGARSPLLSAASEEAMQYVPAVPRVVKRVHNHLCIMIFILHGRNLLNSSSELRPKEVGKWIAMRERWPKTAEKVIRHPQYLQRLEADAEKRIRSSETASNSETGDSIKDEPDGDLSPYERELLDFLIAAPLLSPVIEKLVNFR